MDRGNRKEKTNGLRTGERKYLILRDIKYLNYQEILYKIYLEKLAIKIHLIGKNTLLNKFINSNRLLTSAYLFAVNSWK